MRTECVVEKYFEVRGKLLKSLRGKARLTPDEWVTIVYETWAIVANHNTDPFDGGTRSSENLRVSMGHLELLNSGIIQPAEFNYERPSLDDLIQLTQANLEAAVVVVERHNEQANKFIEYDIATEMPVEDDQTEKSDVSASGNGGAK